MPLTRQEIFNKNWNWFVTKGKPKAFSLGCVYHTDESACAIGCCMKINDRRHLTRVVRKWDNTDIVSVQILYSDLYDKYFMEEDLEFLKDLQLQHDNSTQGESFSEEIKRRLTKFANKYNLEIPNE